MDTNYFELSHVLIGCFVWTEHDYPSVFQERYSMLFHGPISNHQNEVQANLSIAITTHLERERLCFGDVCEVGDVIMKCEEETDYVIGGNITCLDEEERTDFFINFNITLRNKYETFGFDTIDR